MKHQGSRRLFMLGALSFCLPAASQVLHITRDAEGKVNITDQPPPGATYDRQPAVQRPHAPSRPAQAPSLAAPASVATDGVVLFGADWCPHCRRARAYLNERGIPFVEYNVDTQQGKAAMASVNGGRGIPFLIAGERRQRGFSVASYDAIFGGTRRRG